MCTFSVISHKTILRFAHAERRGGMPQCILFDMLLAMFFILTVTHIHPCKDEARANKLKRFKESLCERIWPQSCYITPKKKKCEMGLKEHICKSVSDVWPKKLVTYSDMCNDLQYSKCKVFR